jgi:hypothetical protein
MPGLNPQRHINRFYFFYSILIQENRLDLNTINFAKYLLGALNVLKFLGSIPTAMKKIAVFSDFCVILKGHYDCQDARTFKFLHNEILNHPEITLL